MGPEDGVVGGERGIGKRNAGSGFEREKVGAMNYDEQLKLQAYLDGELPEGEARTVANWLARDREAVALHNELRNTRKALAGFEVGVTLPESREFYWSKIEREIRRLEPAESVRPKPSLFAAWRRFLVSAGAAAGLALVAVVVGNQLGLVSLSPSRGAETNLADSGAFTYHDYSAGVTLVWLSYPADSDAGGGTEPDTVN